MRFSTLFSGILVLAASILTYAAPYGTPETFLDIERRATQGQHSHYPPGGTGAGSASGSHDGSQPSATGVGRQITIIGRPLDGTNIALSPPAAVLHWAVLVGGRYYELAMDESIPNQASSSPGLHGAAIKMQTGEMPAGVHTWRILSSHGVTHLNDEEIAAMGQRVMTAMAPHNYNMFNNNCQDFATQLAACIVAPTDPVRRHCCIIA